MLLLCEEDYEIHRIGQILFAYAEGRKLMKRLLILQIVGCILFATLVLLLYISGLFSPLSVIIVYVIMGFMNIINARVMLIKPIEDLSTHDKLTGCYNRIKLESKIPEYEKFSDYAVIFFDVNNLKRINDIHGHNDGDKILVNASNQLRYWHKYGDLYRIGGDEFIVVVTNMNQIKLDQILTEWYSNLSILNDDPEDNFKCNFSYGVQYKTVSNSTTFRNVMESADEKMYDMKNRIKRLDGKNSDQKHSA